MLDNILEINTTLSRRWKEYVVEKLNRKFELEGGATFKRGTVWSITDKGIFVEYNGNKARITAAGNPRKFLAPSTISKNYDLGGTSFVRDTLGVADYLSGSKKTQRRAEKAYISARDVPQLGETPIGRPKGERKVLDGLQKTNQDMEGLGTDFTDVPIAEQDIEGLGVDLANVPIADNEEISTFLTEQGQLKRLSDVYEHLVMRRDEKEAELKNLKSKGDRTVSFVNPAYEGEEGEALLPVSEEDADRARELEAEIKELDTAITDQEAKVRNSLQHLRLSIENFIDSDSTLGNRVRALFRREGVTIASLLTAVVGGYCASN